MKLYVIALRDIKADVYGQPIFVTNLGAAIRDFGDQVKDPKNGSLHGHPEDFELFHIGEYDDNTGMIEPLETFKQLAVGSNYKTEK